MLLGDPVRLRPTASSRCERAGRLVRDVRNEGGGGVHEELVDCLMRLPLYVGIENYTLHGSLDNRSKLDGAAAVKNHM